MDMAIDRKLILKQSEAEVQIYASTFYYMELNVAVMLRELNVKYDFRKLRWSRESVKSSNCRNWN